MTTWPTPNLATNRRQRAYRAVRHLHAIYVVQLQHQYASITVILLRSTIDGWASIYNFASTIRQGARKDPDDIVLNTVPFVSWDGPFKTLARGRALPTTTRSNPSSSSSTFLPTCRDETPTAESPSSDASIAGTPTSATMIYPSTFLRASPRALTASEITVSHHLATLDGVSTPPESPEGECVMGYQLVRGRNGVIALLYERHCTGFLSPFREHDLDPQHSRRHILLWWSDTPTQHQQVNHLHGQMHIGAAQQKLSRSHGPFFLAPGYTMLSGEISAFAHSAINFLPGHMYGTRFATVSDGWGRSPSAPSDPSPDTSYIICFLGDPGPSKVDLQPAHDLTGRQLWIVVPTTPLDWYNSQRRTADL